MDPWIIIAVTLVLSAFFSGVEIAYVSANKLELELNRKKGRFQARILAVVIRSPSRFIGAMLIGNNVALVIYGIAMAGILEPLAGAWTDSRAGVLVVQTVISTFIVLLTAEFLPKMIFRINPVATLTTLAAPIGIIYYILYLPVVVVVGISELLIRKLMRTDPPPAGPMYGRIDLDLYLREATTGIRKTEEMDPEIQIFRNALAFSNVKVKECMVPRTEIVAVEATESIPNLRKKFTATGLSKILIYKGTIEHIIGYVHSYELFRNPPDIRAMLLPIVIAPETMPAGELMEKLIRGHRSVAVVVDEFGGTAGMVTMEDIIEEIFGEIEDEHDREALTEKQTAPGEYLFSGRLEIDCLNERYHLGLPESVEYETLAGLIMHHYQSIPDIGQEISIGPLRFAVKKATETRIELIQLRMGGEA